ncbi:hypothetical protein BDN72DRAFT_866028 [Pluteus cervinus]|uniref:Uncharacterized protein n=1 Tax=Pluteus cervinus TaxID=181527 RepID=A0ACD2ZZ14_9AGAR|nr:hypothetical protein BDN72DRAFT_866028 [Pluteus cervinus]
MRKVLTRFREPKPASQSPDNSWETGNTRGLKCVRGICLVLWWTACCIVFLLAVGAVVEAAEVDKVLDVGQETLAPSSTSAKPNTPRIPTFTAELRCHKLILNQSRL